MGAKVILFEAAAMGGDCLNSGCVPSKALLAVAKAAHYASGASHMGVTATPPKIDFAAVKAHVAAVIDGIALHDSGRAVRGIRRELTTEHAAFTGPREVASNHHRVRAKYFVIATGSQPVIPPIDGLEDVDFHTNETIFADPAKPSHLVIIGGGPIGMEMAQAHIRLGVDVTLVEALSVMARDDDELVTMLKTQLKDEGVTFIEGVGVTSVRQTQLNNTTLTLADGRSLKASHLLIAAGRQPVTGGLNLPAAGVDCGKNGIVTDRRLRTSNKRVYAIGDVTGRQQFTHMASYHAGICLRNILFKYPAKMNETAVPHADFQSAALPTELPGQIADPIWMGFSEERGPSLVDITAHKATVQPEFNEKR